MNYQELFSQIQAYTENQFPDFYLANNSTVNVTTQINTFIQQAEERIYNTVQIPSLRKNVTGNCTPNGIYLACPNDYLSTYSLAVIDSTNSMSSLAAFGLCRVLSMAKATSSAVVFTPSCQNTSSRRWKVIVDGLAASSISQDSAR